MATNPRPTTEFHITYGALNTPDTARTLNPVLIAPRYAIHSYEDGYEESYIGKYIGQEVTAVWPGKGAKSVVDLASAAVYVNRPYVKLNDEAISGTVDETTKNKITTTDSLIHLAGMDYEDALRGYSVGVGDFVDVTVNGSTERATVTGIGATRTAAEVGAIETVNGSTYTGASSSGTFTGTENAVYLIKVLTTPEAGDTSVNVQVIALSGDDLYAATTLILSAGVAANIGTKGAKVTFTNGSSTAALTTLQAGDAFSIPCSAPAVSKYNIIYINKEIVAESSSASSGDDENAGEVTLSFSSNKITGDYVRVPSSVSFASSGITVGTGIYLNIAGIPCELVQGDLYVVYRELLTEGALQVVAASATGAAAFAGVADPRNPLGMLYAAASQVANGFFYMVATTGPADADYTTAINYAAQFEDLYAFVTYEDTPAIEAAKVAAMSKYSNPLIAQFKKVWYAPTIEKEDVVYAKDANDNVLLASIAANGEATLASPGNAITGGVAPGDYMVVYTSVDENSGEWATVRYLVDSVVDSDTIKLSNSMETTLSRVEFVRELSNSDYARKVAAVAAGIDNERVNMVWCAGQASMLGFSDVKPTVVAAVEATMRSALPPHAPLTGLAVPGLTLNDSYGFSGAEYEILNDGGVWVVSNNSFGVATNYHQITTLTNGTVAEEDSCVSAGDAIVRELRNALSSLANGSVNVTDELLEAIRLQVNGTMNMIIGRVYNELYGPMVIDYDILTLERPESNNAAVLLKMDVDTPQPLLKGQFYFNIM